MRGQMMFPTGFGCDPTVASGQDLRAYPVPRPRAATTPRRAPIQGADIRLMAQGRVASRLEEIEAQRRTSRSGGMAPALWSSAAIGLVLAGSLYFLNYF